MRRRTVYRIAAPALAAMLTAAAVFALVRRGHRPADTADARADGSAACRECHEDFYRLWATSRHGLAMQPAGGLAAAGQLRPTTRPVRIGNAEYSVAVGPGGAVLSENAGGASRSYPLLWALGGRRVYYLLTSLERGRLQVVPLAYDVGRGEWYDLAASGAPHATAGPAPDWRDPSLTFNTSCHGCHVSRMSGNYDAASDTYRTTWTEPGISCETCHGPGQEHIRAARALAPGQKLVEPRLISTRSFTPEQHNAACLGCHAKVSPISRAWKPGEKFFDHYDLVTLESPDYWPDGRDLGENYTGTGWLLNACAARGGLHCLHCHTSSGRYRFGQADPAEANRACLPCHEDRVRDAASHTQHREDGPAAFCVACHMPATEFARMTRSDHSLRPPMPAATLAMGSPNACNLCHTDRDAAWADAEVRRWRQRDYQAPTLRLGAMVAAARRRDFARLPEMLAYITDSGRNEVFAASLLRLLRPCADGRKWPAVLAAAKDPSPLVRAAAISALEGRTDPETAAVLAAAAEDEYRLVRMRAAAALAAFPAELLAPGQRAVAERAFAELAACLSARADDWTARCALGDYHADRGRLRQALDEYRTASRLRPDAVQPLVNAALVYARLNDAGGAEEVLTRAIRLQPDNAAVSYNLALLRAQQGRTAEAQDLLRKALRADPAMAQAAHSLAVLVAADRPEEAVELCRQACRSAPDEPRYAYALGFYLFRAGRISESIAALEEVLRRFPDHHAACILLGEVHEKTGNRAAARDVYRRALARTDLPARERDMIARRIGRIDDPGGSGGRP